MARLEKTMTVTDYKLVDLNTQDIRILDMALAMYKDADNKGGLSDGLTRGRPLLNNDERWTLNQLHALVLEMSEGI